MKNVKGISIALGLFLVCSYFQAFGLQNDSSNDNQLKCKFNFTNTQVNDCINLSGDIPIYSSDAGYGFVSETSSMPSRTVDVSRIQLTDDGFIITENDSTINWVNSNNYNYGGMVFRIDVPDSGAYNISVTTTSDSETTFVAPSGMQASRLIDGTAWDSAELVSRNNKASWKDKTWSYDFVTGEKYIEIEVEPKLNTKTKPTDINATVGISNITLTPIGINENKNNEKPTIFVLGDSTVKSYTFDETGMSGWGQVFDKMFDLSKVSVINYSMGGRSFRSMYSEGRFNDVLMTGKANDYVLVQSGHNDESLGDSDGPEARFGRGSTAEIYEKWIKDIYIPAIRARGMIPILVTPMTRINASQTSGDQVFFSGFKNSSKPGIDFPGIMKSTGEKLGVAIVDLYEDSMKYLNEIGGDATGALYMSVEAGESPGKTNTGSYANGSPANKLEGTHFKEALAKQFARIVVTDLSKIDKENAANSISNYIKDDVKAAIKNEDWSHVFPEIASDTEKGPNSYYRNQIEKMLQLGVMQKDQNGKFNPKDSVTVGEFAKYICKVWGVDESKLSMYIGQPNNFVSCDFSQCELNRETMAAILYDAYNIKFGKDQNGNFNKPKYMTDYNGKNVSPDDPNYDPNLIGNSAQYYPLVGYNALTDNENVSDIYVYKVREAYNLGLIRSEFGIERGKMENGTLLEPLTVVTREKAAKTLYFCFALAQNIKTENDLDTLNY
jgi:lysophospholipase L1-like esterase